MAQKNRVGRIKVAITLFSLLAAVPFVLFTPKAANAITVGPAKLEYKVDPGKTVEGQMLLQNEGANVKTATFYPVFERFTEDNGSKQFTEEESDLSTWFKITEEVTLGPGETRQIPFQIAVPKDAAPGGHFAVMWWSTAPAKSKGSPSQQVSVVTRAGILVYLTVSGDIKEVGAITNFTKDKKIYNSLPAHFTISFKNSGNVHLIPRGEIAIKNLFGQTITSLVVNKNKQQVLPQSNRNFDATWESGRIIGIYRAHLNLNYGASGSVEQTVWLFLLPWKLILGILIGLFILIIALPKGIKKYNQWIISKAQIKP